jgi:hypothetical protein
LRESKLKPAAYERAADQRGSRVLIRSRNLSTHCQMAVGFFVFQPRMNTNRREWEKREQGLTRIARINANSNPACPIGENSRNSRQSFYHGFHQGLSVV